MLCWQQESQPFRMQRKPKRAVNAVRKKRNAVKLANAVRKRLIAVKLANAVQERLIAVKKMQKRNAAGRLKSVAPPAKPMERI